MSLIIGRNAVRQLKADHAKLKHIQPGVNGGGPKRDLTQRRLQVILDEDLFAATDSLTDPATAEATVLKKDGTAMVETTRTITLVNRCQGISVPANTYGKAEWIDGEWQLYAADCPLASSSSGV